MPCESGKHDGPAGTTCVIRVGLANLTFSWRSAIYQHGALHAFYCSWCSLATWPMTRGPTTAITVPKQYRTILDRSSNKQRPSSVDPWSQILQYGVTFGVLSPQFQKHRIKRHLDYLDRRVNNQGRGIGYMGNSISSLPPQKMHASSAIPSQ
jgi:hypothetical protein